MERRILLLSLLFLALFSVESFAKKKIKSVIITGQNNHNWAVTHKALDAILDNSLLFDCDVAVSPAKGEDMSDFIVDFDEYELVVLDYNGDRWSEEMDAAFEKYVKSGGGVVVVHAADNAFVAWPFYNRVIAVGGWEGRTEKDGAHYYWKDDKLVANREKGRGGSHGAQHEFLMNGRDTKHPITKGLPEVWKHAKDELYDRMRGPGNIKDVLYTAYSSKETGGSGYEEPLIFTVDLGKARIFHTMLGHAGKSMIDNPAMQCTGFQVTLLRGAEWAATGKVKQRVPSDFPTKDKVSMRMNYME